MSLVSFGERIRRSSILVVALCAMANAAIQKEDYLTEQEIEDLREAQEPADRIKLLTQILENRLQPAQLIKDPSSVKAPSEKSKSGSSKKVEPAKSASPTEQKGFLEWISEYVQCLDEISNNIENFSTVNTDPKPYLKSLTKLNEVLRQNGDWFHAIDTKLQLKEQKAILEAEDVRKELDDDVQAEIERLEEQLVHLKEAEKAKSKRSR